MFAFVLISVLLIPGIMAITGFVWRKYPPKHVNSIYGYRTGMSMKNQDTWEFAHAHCAKVWLLSGSALLALSAIGLYIFKSDVERASTIITVFQLFVLILSIIPTTLALHKSFDKNGNRKV